MRAKSRGAEWVLVGVLNLDGVPALAEDLADDGDGQRKSDPRVEEIVIEAERGDAIPLMQTSYSVDVFTEEELRRGTDRQMTDLLQRVPNVTVDPRFGGPTIRGVSNRGFAGAIPNTVTYADGAFTPTLENLWDARQVTVSRGPESYMSGGWIGGISDVDSNDPTDEPDGNMTASWAPEMDDRRLGVAYGNRATDTLSYRLAAYARSSDGAMENVTRHDSSWNSHDERMARAKLRWIPGALGDTVVNFRAEYLRNRTNGSSWVGGVPPIDPFDRTAFDDEAAHDEATVRSAHVEFQHDWNDRWSSQLILGVGDQESETAFDAGFTAADEGTVATHEDRDWISTRFKLFYDSGPWHLFLRQYATRFDVSNAWQIGAHTYNFVPGVLPPVEGETRYVFRDAGMVVHRHAGRHTPGVRRSRAVRRVDALRPNAGSRPPKRTFVASRHDR